MPKLPKLFVSPCLGVFPCRYDGKEIVIPWSTSLYEHFEIMAFCPELEIGLSMPRPPIKLIQTNDALTLESSEGKIDYSIDIDFTFS